MQKKINGENNGWEGEPDGFGCYFDCVNLNNYDSIPEYWKVDNER